MFFYSFAAQAASPNHTLLAKGGVSGWLNTMRPIKEADMEGRLVLLDFWTYGCINCMQIVPDLEYLEQKFGDKLLVIGVHSAKFKGEQANYSILAAAKRFGILHPVINDSDFAVWEAFKVRAWPTQILLGPDGQEIARYTGEGHRADLERDISAALGTVTNTSSLAGFVDHRKEGRQVLSFPSKLAYAPEYQMFFVTDTGHSRIVAFNASGQVTMVIGSGAEGLADGDLAAAQFRNPRGLTYKDGILYIADTGNHVIRRANLGTRTVETIAGTGARGAALHAVKVPALETPMASPWDVELLPDNKTLAIAMAGTHQLWTYNIKKGTVSVLAGTGAEGITDGKPLEATLAQPSGLANVGKSLFFVDAESSALRVLEGGKIVKTLVGTGLFDYGHKDGAYPEAMLQHPQGLTAGKHRVMIADTYNNAIRFYDRPTGMMWTLGVVDGGFNEPGDIMIVGSMAYVVDTNDHSIKRLNPETGAVVMMPVMFGSGQ